MQHSVNLPDKVFAKHLVPDSMGKHDVQHIVSEAGICDLVLESRITDAEAFKHWIFQTLISLLK